MSEGRSLRLFGAAGAVAAIIVWRYITSKKNQAPYPPGPKPLPLIGNFLDVPSDKAWVTYARWGKQYGDVIHIESFGQHIVILNSYEANTDLLDRRSSIYSSRPSMTKLCQLMGFQEWDFGMMEYGERWRTQRRIFHSQTHQSASVNYRGIQLRETRACLQRLVNNPEDFALITRYMFGRTIINLVYGLQDTNNIPRFLKAGDKMLEYFSLALRPGVFLVDLIPALRFLPRWFPGAGFHKVAEDCRRVNQIILDEPLEALKENITQGTAEACMMTKWLDMVESGKETVSETDLKGIAALAYAGGTDSTTASMLVFLNAMASNPEVLARAQAEIDSVIGHDRLPDFGDRTDLPYLQAVYWETLRWQPTIPLVPPHFSIADDIYRGYLIPKGTILLPNAWAVLRDPNIYPEPEAYRPERFLTQKDDGRWLINSGMHLPNDVFGYGRRLCAGRHIVDQSLWIFIVSMLAAFDISPITNEQGEPELPKIEMTPYALSAPVPFKCVIKPRSQQALDLIQTPLPDRDI